jgi:phosphatidylinositol-bisphosphatase
VINSNAMPGTRPRPGSTSTTSSLMQDVPGGFPSREDANEDESGIKSLTQAIHARRAEYVKPKHMRIKIGTWNTAAYKGAEKDVGGWFVDGKGVTEALAGLKVGDPSQVHGGDEIPDQSGLEAREDVATQEARYERKKATVPEHDPGSIPGGDDIGLYVLGLQEVVDITSVSEALRPFTDPSIAKKWKVEMEKSLPKSYTLVAEQQLLGLLLLIYAAPDIASEVRSVSTTSVGTGLGGYMGNKGAVTARIVLGDTTRIVFVNSHLAAGADKTSLERRNWDASQIISRTRFGAIQDAMDLSQTTGEQIGDEDFAFWVGDLNYRLEGIPGDDVRRLLMLHTRNEYDLSQQSANKIEKEIENATDAVKQRVETRISIGSRGSAHEETVSQASARSSSDTLSKELTLEDEIEASEDPTSLQTTLSCLLPHDELHQQMKLRKAFHDGWQEGPINFLPTYKYDVGSVGVFDSSEKKRAPSWCDRILYRSRRDKLAYEAMIKEEELAKKKDEEMKSNGTDEAALDDEILYDYDPEADGDDNNDYDEYDETLDAPEGVVITREGFEDEIHLEYYAAHQRILSSDHKPLDAVFMLKYDAVNAALKAKVHAEVAKELDKVENDSRPGVTVVVDKHRPDDTEHSDQDPANFEGVWFGPIRWAQAKHRSLTVANTGRVSASFTLIERPVGPGQAPGIAPKWLNLKINDATISSTISGTDPLHLEPGETANIELELRVFDMHIVQALNEGIRRLEDILVLRVEGGRDHFVPIRADWQASSLGRSIDKLIRIPEGGIRKLQSQRPDSSKGVQTASHARAGSDSYGSNMSGNSSRVSLDDAPVRFSAPRELFRLTEAIEELSARVVAEHEMTVSKDSPAPLWQDHPAWPFDEACWVERGTEQWDAALSELCNALDEDLPLEASMPDALPKLQRLYVLASFLLIFLDGLTDGIVTPDQWPAVEDYLSELERSKRNASLDEQRTALQEALSQSSGHSISFVLITSMLDRLVQDVHHSSRPKEEPPMSPISPTRMAMPFRRMTGLGRVPAAPEREQAAQALAKVFAPVVIKAGEPSTERLRARQKKRKIETLEVFLKKDTQA